MSEKKVTILEVLAAIVKKMEILEENQTLILNELKPRKKPVIKQEIELPKVKVYKKSPGFPKKKDKTIYELPGKIIDASDKAFFIKLEGHKEEWFPKSQITNASNIDDENQEDTQVFNFTEWILKQKGVL